MAGRMVLFIHSQMKSPSVLPLLICLVSTAPGRGRDDALDSDFTAGIRYHELQIVEMVDASGTRERRIKYRETFYEYNEAEVNRLVASHGPAQAVMVSKKTIKYMGFAALGFGTYNLLFAPLLAITGDEQAGQHTRRGAVWICGGGIMIGFQYPLSGLAITLFNRSARKRSR